MDYAERLARAEIRTWPKGTFRFLDYIDDDGFSDEPIPIAVAVTVHDDHVSVDYAGTSSQVMAPLNSTKSYTNSCTYLSVRCVLKADIPNNAGVFRCIEVKAPEGSVLNPLMPAACAARALTGYRVVDAMFGALAQIVPDRVPAAGEGGIRSSFLRDGARSLALHHRRYDLRMLGWTPGPGRYRGDHQSVAELVDMPVEVMEAQHPVRLRNMH